MAKKKKSKRGGKRPGAGRPRKEPTTVIAFRVPIKEKDSLKSLIKQLIKEYETIIEENFE